MIFFKAIYSSYFQFFYKKIEGDKLISHINALLMLSVCQYSNLTAVFLSLKVIFHFKFTFSWPYFSFPVLGLILLNFIFTLNHNKNSKRSGWITIAYTFMSFILVVLTWYVVNSN